MKNNTLETSMGISFSLIETQLHAIYEKNERGYAVLLIPSEQTPDSGISVKDLTDNIKRMAKDVPGSDTAVDTTQLETAITEVAKEGGGSTSTKLEGIVIKLQMAYPYIRERGENSVLEYAFQLRVVIEGLVPETIKFIVDMTNLSTSVWNTDRKKIVDKMALVTVDEYLGAVISPDKSQAARQRRKHGLGSYR